jgi:putative transposase
MKEVPMARRKRPLATLWEVPDELWIRIEPLLKQLDPPANKGRKREDRRRVLDGIIFHLRTGCQWNHIPHVYGDDSTIFRCFQRWCEVGLFTKLWAKLIRECDELRGVQWKWQAADGMLGKARFGGAQLAPTPPIAGKTARKRAC